MSRELEGLKAKFGVCIDFDYDLAFDAIDTASTGIIGYDNLELFLARSGVMSLLEDDLVAILRRMDHDDNGMLYFKEFTDGITPLHAPVRESTKRRSSQKRLMYDTKPASSGAKPLGGIRKAKAPQSPLKRLKSTGKKSTGANTSIQATPTKSAKSGQKQSEKSPSTAMMTPAQLRQQLRVDHQRALSITHVDDSRASYGRASDEKSRDLSKSKRTSPAKGSVTRMSTQGRMSDASEHLQVRRVLMSELKSNDKEKLGKIAHRTLGSESFGREEVNKSLNMSIKGEKRRKAREIANFLKNYIKLERECELAKDELALRVDFNVGDAFKCFDRNHKGFATVGELETGLRSLGIQVTKEQLYLFMRRYDTDLDGRISFAEFCPAILPTNTDYLALIKGREPLILHESKQLFTRDTQEKFIHLIEMILENELYCEHVRKGAAIENVFKLDEVFALLDRDEDGFIYSKQVTASFS